MISSIWQGKRIRKAIVFLPVFLIGLVILLVGCAPQAQVKPAVVMAVQPTEAVAELTARAEELKNFLEKETGFQVKVFVPTSYTAVVEALKFNNADVALMGALPALWANVRAGTEVALAEVREVAEDDKAIEATYYYSHFNVLKDSPYKSIEELRGKKVAFASPISTSGFLFPVAELVRRGLISPSPAGQSLLPDDLKKSWKKSFSRKLFSPVAMPKPGKL